MILHLMNFLSAFKTIINALLYSNNMMKILSKNLNINYNKLFVI